MVPVRVNIACGDYDRTQALIDGTVQPEGLKLRWFPMSHGEMWRQILNDSDIQVSELSLAWHVIARTLGKPLLAMRFFRRALSGTRTFSSTRIAASMSRAI